MSVLFEASLTTIPVLLLLLAAGEYVFGPVPGVTGRRRRRRLSRQNWLIDLSAIVIAALSFATSLLVVGGVLADSTWARLIAGSGLGLIGLAAFLEALGLVRARYSDDRPAA